ncbi:MAG TPA: hypothetical protein VFK37_07965 [Bacillales bacterium]|nr:hypothetical protein [Bacillales bacterium]
MDSILLKRKATHKNLHKAAYLKAEKETARLREMWENGESQVRLLQVAFHLIDHWEKTTLTHAEDEEKNLYVDMVRYYPKLSFYVMELIEEHELLRHLVKESKEFLINQGFHENVLSRFETLLLVNEYHNLKEEARLLGIHYEKES